MKDKKLLLILNPVAGQKRVNRMLTNILSIFCRNGYECTTQVTSKEIGAKEIIRRSGRNKDLIVCIGGDGTFNETVSECIKSTNTAQIGYIPTGTTNDFANNLNLPTNPIVAVKTIIKGKPQKIDVGCIDNKIFTYVASFGAFTKASYSTPKEMKNSLGFFAYILSGVKEVADIRSYNIVVDTPDKHIEGEYVFGGVCNSKRIGGVFQLPENEVDMNDGLLEVFLIKRPRDPSEFMELLHDLNTGNYKSKMIDFFSVENVSFTFDRRMHWTIDGEHYKGNKTSKIKVIKNAFSIRH